MFCNHPNLKILYIYTSKKYLFTKLTYFDHPNKNVKNIQGKL